jgi:hypothetical protein
MNKNHRNKLVLTALGVSVASTILFTSANAKDRHYHRIDNTHVITIPDKAQAPSPKDYRAVTEAEAKKLEVKTETSGAANKEKLHKYHHIESTRVVWLRTMPDKGYQTEEQFSKAKKEK